MQSVALVEVGDPRDVLRLIVGAVRVLAAHRLDLVLQIDVVGAGDGGGGGGTIDDGDWAAHDRRSLIGGHRLGGQVDVDPFLAVSRLVSQILSAVGDLALLPLLLIGCHFEAAGVGLSAGQSGADRRGDRLGVVNLLAGDRFDAGGDDLTGGVDVSLSDNRGDIGGVRLSAHPVGHRVTVDR